MVMDADTEPTEETELTESGPGSSLPIDDLPGRVIGAAIEVHRRLGPGMLESTYELCLCHEFELAGIRFENQKVVPLRYKGLTIPTAYRIDILIENTLVLELKSVEKLLEVHKAQVLSYMRLSGYPLGLLINFHVPLLKDGVRRFKI
jgi:GxxExxY protein